MIQVKNAEGSAWSMAVVLGMILWAGAAFAENSFMMALWEKSFAMYTSEEVFERGAIKVTRMTRNGKPLGKDDDPDLTYVQTPDSVSVFDDSAGVDIEVLLFTTKDKAMELPGGVKIGGKIDAALKDGVISASMSKMISRA
jgi:hypothetical protein